jgi:hypothetical protein
VEVLMIENYRSGLLWRLMRGCPYLADGLRRAVSPEVGYDRFEAMVPSRIRCGRSLADTAGLQGHALVTRSPP